MGLFDAMASTGNTITSGIFQLGGMALGNKWAKQAAERQHKYNKEIMKIQHGYNIESQQLGQQYNKEMWDYTNYENQKRHLEAAGLNPALLYGMGGGGGATAAGAQGSGSSAVGGNEMAAGNAQKAMGLMMGEQWSRIASNLADAALKKAETNKVKGVDTDLQNANIEYIIAQTSNEKVKKGLIYANTRLLDAQEELQRTSVDYTKQKTDEIRWNIKLVEKEVDRLAKEIDGLDLDNEYKKETLKNRIKQTNLAIQQAIADIALKGSQGRLNNEEAKAIPEKILQMWSEIGIKQEGVEISRGQMENYAQDIAKRLHLHGIFWGCGIESIIREKWQNGFIFVGNYVSQRTINYITKYMLKTDLDHPMFKGKVLCSAGIGSGYEKSINAKNNKFKGEETNETYRLPNGAKTNLPIYYRNKIYSEEEREALFLSKVEKGIVWICGEKCFIDDAITYNNLLLYHQGRASRLYHDNPQIWEAAKYERKLARQREANRKAMRKKAYAARV
jgi:hypothetical protein